MQDGWIKIHRKIFENKYYFAEKFTKMQAWIDLLLLANHKEGYFEKRGIGVNIERGQLAYSEKTLSKRWQWSRGKVRRFLFILEMEQQIVQQKSNITTLISILNYNSYQDVVQQTVPQTDTKRTPNGTQTRIIKKEKIDKRKLLFGKQLSDYVKIYGKGMVGKFYDYWTEPNKSGTKLRFEMQQTWDLSKRLNRWSDNNKQFIKKEKESYGTTN